MAGGSPAPGGVADAESARVYGEWRNQRRREIRRVCRRRLPAGLVVAALVVGVLWATQPARWAPVAGAVCIGAAVMFWPLRPPGNDDAAVGGGLVSVARRPAPHGRLAANRA